MISADWCDINGGAGVEVSNTGCMILSELAGILFTGNLSILLYKHMQFEGDKKDGG